MFRLSEQFYFYRKKFAVVNSLFTFAFMKKTLLIASMVAMSCGFGLTVANAQTNGNGDPCENSQNRPKFCDDPLPVTLVSFTATPFSQGVRLEWVTATETNHSHYVVQRSFDGKKFENLVTTYDHAFEDKRPGPGNYYRLVSVDLDLSEHIYYIIFARYKSGLFTVYRPDGMFVGVFDRFDEIPKNQILIINNQQQIILN